MHVSVSFSRGEGFALAATMEAVQRLTSLTPVLVEIPYTFTHGPHCHFVAVFQSGSSFSGKRSFTAEVRIGLGWPPEGWVRVFTPDWVTAREFRQGELIFSGNKPELLEVKVRTLIRVPLAELHWEELPDHLQELVPRWV